MNAKNGKKLDQLQKDYFMGKLTPEEYIKKAFVYKDGDETRKEIMKNFHHLAKNLR